MLITERQAPSCFRELARQGYKRIEYKTRRGRGFHYEKAFNAGLLRRTYFFSDVKGGLDLFRSHSWNFPRLKEVNRKFGQIIERAKTLKKIAGEGKSTWAIKEDIRELLAKPISNDRIENESSLKQLKRLQGFDELLFDLRELRNRYKDLIDTIRKTDELRADRWDLYSVDAIDGNDASIKDRLEIARFALYCGDSYSLEQRAGAPRETQSLTLAEQILVEKMHRCGKGTPKGSPRMIASEIGLEQRKYSDRTWKKKESALIQGVKRHLRRKGLIRRK